MLSKLKLYQIDTKTKGTAASDVFFEYTKMTNLNFALKPTASTFAPPWGVSSVG